MTETDPTILAGQVLERMKPILGDKLVGLYRELHVSIGALRHAGA